MADQASKAVELFEREKATIKTSVLLLAATRGFVNLEVEGNSASDGILRLEVRGINFK